MKSLLICATFIFTTPAFAELCDEPKTQADMNYCAEYHFTQADAELNDIYGRLKSAYVNYAAPKKALIGSQRAWLVFRDAECKQDETATDGGSAASMVVLECRIKLTAQRAEQLQQRLDCKEGDFACVHLGDSAD
jgi:uncharacterized protein YecT (DUF1311 family)